MNDVLAYHIIWTMQGTWLPGDWRGWVKKRIQGILPPDPEIERQARERMAEPMVLLTDEQRAIVERTIADLEAARPTLDGFVHVPDLACHEGIGAASGGGLSAGAWSRSAIAPVFV